MHGFVLRLLLVLGLSSAIVPAALAQQCPPAVPVQGAPPPAPLPVFPVDNWWNADVSAAPVDPSSASYIAFINNGGSRKLHPDFGGEESPGSIAIYGFPYAVVDGSQPKKTVVFDYDDESDGSGIPFYPIPAQAITQAHWVEGGAPGNVDQRNDGDRHLLVIDCTNRYLYELYNVWYSSAQQQWHAGSGAFFDMNRNDRRPDGWTSADAAGLAIFPGLVRYDEAANAATSDLGHALRVTVRATNGYVYPASHRAGSTSGALPMGARLRLKSSVNGSDPALRTGDPIARRIFRSMQRYGLIVADNGSDMYISGTFDLRWDNGVLNPAFSTLSASDFEVVKLGWKPAATPLLSAVSASPNPVTGGQPSTGTVTLASAAPTGGATVSLASASSAFSVPASVAVPAGATSANFTISTVASATTASGTLSASHAGITRTTVLTVNPAAPPVLSIDDAAIAEGNSGTRALTFTVHLSYASAGTVSYDIATADGSAKAGSDYVARSLGGETIAAGQTSRTFAVAINGDTRPEANETFTVMLAAPVGASIGDGLAIGTILTDEVPPVSRPLPPLPSPGQAPSGAPAATSPAGTDGMLACAWPLRSARAIPAGQCLREISLRWRTAWHRLWLPPEPEE